MMSWYSPAFSQSVKRIRRLAPEVYGRPVRVATSEVFGFLPK